DQAIVLLKGVLCSFALGDILRCTADELGLPFRGFPNHGESVPHPSPLTIRVFHPILSLTARSLRCGEKGLMLILETTEIFGGHKSSEECQVLPWELFRVIAQCRAHLLVDVPDPLFDDIVKIHHVRESIGKSL